MSWNEPGGQKPKDPWGGGGGGDQRPPDLDEVLKNLSDKFSGLFGGKGGGNGGGQGKGGFLPLVILLVAAAVFYLFLGAVTVDNQERAVVLSFGKYDRTLEPGLNWHWPPVEEYAKVNVDDTRSYALREEMLTEDTNIVGVSLEVQYRVLDAELYLLRVSEPDDILQHATESALRQVVGSGTMDDALINRREEIAVQVKKRLQEYLDGYDTGLYVVQLVLKETVAPNAVRDAFDDVSKAKEDEDRFKKEAEAYANAIIPQARGEAQRLIEEANAYKEEVIARAEGETERFTKLLAEYRKAPEVTRERLFIDAMEEVLTNSSKVMVDVKDGNNLMYLPLDQIVSKHRNASPESMSSSQRSAESVIGEDKAASSSKSGGYGSYRGGLR